MTGKNSLQLYRLGLIGLGVFTLVLLIMLVVQATGAKQDSTTYEKANEVATKLDDYINTNQKLPDSLAALHVEGVPSTVNYVKKNSTTYKFCVTYKAASQNFGISNITDGLTGAGLNSLGQSGDNTYGSSSFSDSSYLYVSPTHKKGQNCQAITPYLYNSSGLYGSPTSTIQSKSTTGYSAADGCQAGNVANTKGNVKNTSPAAGSIGSGAFALTLTLASGGDKVIQIPASTPIYQSDCTATTPSQLFPQDEVTVFFKTAAMTTPVSIVDNSF